MFTSSFSEQYEAYTAMMKQDGSKLDARQECIQELDLQVTSLPLDVAGPCNGSS